RDTSLRVPPGVEGTVINARVFSRKGIQKDDRSRAIEEDEVAKLRKDQQDEIRIIRESAGKKVLQLLEGKQTAARLTDDARKGVRSRQVHGEDMPCLADGTPVDIVLDPLGVPSRMNVGQILETHLGWAARELGRQIAQELEENGRPNVEALRKKLKELYGTKDVSDFVDALGDDDVVKLARKASRGIHVASPVFDGASEEEIFKLLARATLPANGQTRLFDGRTGEPFAHEVTVGMMYMMKLHHLVDDKIH